MLGSRALLRSSLPAVAPVLTSACFAYHTAPFDPPLSPDQPDDRVGLKGADCSGKTGEVSTAGRQAEEHSEPLDPSRRGISIVVPLSDSGSISQRVTQ